MASPSVDIPDNYDHHFYFESGLGLTFSPIEVKTTVVGDPNQPVATLVTGDPNKPVASLLTGDPAKPITTTLQGNSQSPIASTVDVLNLPHLSKQDIKDLLTPEIRMRIPNYNQICFKLFGVEIFNICLSGESQVITEPYKPNAYERCEVICCEPDTREFPGRPNNPNAGTGLVP